MKAKKKPTREEPLKVSLRFDDALRRAVAVKPPPGGWADYEKKLKRDRQRRRKKAVR